ncbi:MAG: prolipoprotein diacylglyceryl transferase, partial [Firmicutes bacterium]|nr:prolipoprotein diacylglyceryl transferase [Bacillota bacterium]
ALDVYLLSYSILRFLLEFLRGDASRGIILGLSTSQWISIAVFLVILIRRRRMAAEA